MAATRTWEQEYNMLDASILGRLMAQYALEGKDNIDTPIEALENKTVRQMSEESMTKMARAIVEHIQADAEFTAYVPSGQTLVSINGGNSTDGMQINLELTEGEPNTVNPTLIRTPGILGNSSDPTQLKVVVTVQ